MTVVELTGRSMSASPVRYFMARRLSTNPKLFMSGRGRYMCNRPRCTTPLMAGRTMAIRDTGTGIIIGIAKRLIQGQRSVAARNAFATRVGSTKPHLLSVSADAHNCLEPGCLFDQPDFMAFLL